MALGRKSDRDVLSIGNVNNEAFDSDEDDQGHGRRNKPGLSSTRSASLAWVKDITKEAYRPAAPNLGDVEGFAWYTRTEDGNCNNGNCTANCNCGNIECTNCVITGAINCMNCDYQNWLQPNCNVGNCTYNCNTGVVSYNCNCACACDCSGGGGGG